jgi:hypothetical protein
MRREQYFSCDPWLTSGFEAHILINRSLSAGASAGPKPDRPMARMLPSGKPKNPSVEIEHSVGLGSIERQREGRLFYRVDRTRADTVRCRDRYTGDARPRARGAIADLVG